MSTEAGRLHTIRSHWAFLVPLAIIVGMASAVAAPSDARAQSAFSDVSRVVGSASYSEFADEIEWLGSQDITTGWREHDGSVTYRPFSPVTRDAMAAFLYRYAGSPDYEPPAVSPFRDVSSDSAFYREITWLASMEITTGWIVGVGEREYRPFAPISRDAMAAFLYRFAEKPPVTADATFADVDAGSSEYTEEIAWLAAQGITAGYDLPDGEMAFRPYASITRDAMAAFLYRYDHGGLPQFSVPVVGVVGSAAVRSTVTAVTGKWAPEPRTLRYEWLRDGAVIGGAAASSYTLAPADAGHTINVRVIAERDGYLRAVRQSALLEVPREAGAWLAAGERLSPGVALRSPSGEVSLRVSPSGDLALQRGDTVLWHSSTIGNPGSTLDFAERGVLSLRRADGTVAWESTPVGAADGRFTVTDDGRAVITDAAGAETWSSSVQGSMVFRLPFEDGQRWSAGGAHGGVDPTSWNALDFGPGRSGTSTRVVAVASGTVRWLACGSLGYLAVDHDGGWRSSYYHLVNQQTQLIGTYVTSGTYLGDVGSEVPCGGSSTFDHVHLQITYRGVPVPMNGFTIGGFTAYSSGSAYHGYWLDAAGTRVVTARGGAACCLAAVSQ